MQISDAEFHRILVLGITGWDESYGKKTLAELHSLGVIGEREALMSLLSEIEAQATEKAKVEGTEETPDVDKGKTEGSGKDKKA